MFNNFPLTLAVRYFVAKKNERFVSIISGFSLLGVTIGVAALIVVMSVMNGFRIELTKNIIGLNGDIRIRPIDQKIENYESIIGSLKSVKEINQIIPVVTGQALAIGKRANSGALVKGMSISSLKCKKEIIQNVTIGSFDNFLGNNVIAIGHELAYNLGVSVGSSVKLISSTTLPTAFGSMPRAKDFNVIAIFNSGTYEYAAGTILMPIKKLSKFDRN